MRFSSSNSSTVMGGSAYPSVILQYFSLLILIPPRCGRRQPTLKSSSPNLVQSRGASLRGIVSFPVLLFLCWVGELFCTRTLLLGKRLSLRLGMILGISEHNTAYGYILNRGRHIFVLYCYGCRFHLAIRFHGSSFRDARAVGCLIFDGDFHRLVFTRGALAASVDHVRRIIRGDYWRCVGRTVTLWFVCLYDRISGCWLSFSSSGMSNFFHWLLYLWCCYSSRRTVFWDIKVDVVQFDPNSGIGNCSDRSCG